MDVTNGLISRLVKSRSTERVLAPIASQVSLLMILNEVQGEESSEGSALSVSACLERVTQAVDGFIRVGQDQIHRSSDPLFDSQMSAACETLELAKSELFVAGQRISGMPSSSHAHSLLVTAAKDLLQAVLRVLVVVDDVEVRRCVQAVSAVETKVRNVCSVSDSRDLVPAFKELTEALLYMTMLVSRRQKDVVSRIQSEELMTGLSLMRKGMSSLRMATQTHLKYPNNPQAAAGKQQVLDQILTNLANMRTILESGPPDELDAEEAGHFVDHIDKVLENLGEGSRFELSADMESWIASIIRHAMGVAHLCQGNYRHLITRTCQRILQSKFRLFELQEAMVDSPHLSEIRLDYEGVCETLLDEFCEIEKHVNMALLNLIIDTCCFTSQPLEQLATAAIHNQDELLPDVGQSVLAQEFSSHGDRLCQVAGLASASSMDPKKVRAVRLATSRLEQLHPEIVPGIGAVARHNNNAAAIRHLKSLVQEWEKETEAVVRALDSMTDPVVFLHVTEQRMRQGVNVVRGKVSEKDEKGVRAGLQRLLAHARHMTQVATRVVDNHYDAVFRNGLMVFVQQLETARRSVKEASRAAVEDLSHARLVDTLHRRLGLLLDAAADVRQGVKGDNHVDLLNPARQRVRRQYLLADKPSAGERVPYTGKSSVNDKQTTSSQDFIPSSADTITATNTKPLKAATAIPRQATSATPITTTSTSDTGPADIYVPQSQSATADHGQTIEDQSHAGGQSQGGLAKKKKSKKGSAVELQNGGQQRGPGQTSHMLQNCGDEVVASAVGGDNASVARWNGDILGWTSHLGEVALSLLDHCHHASRKREMKELTVEMDRLAPLVIESSRFVAAGDRIQASSLRLLADDWVNTCNKLRILVDVAAGDWLLLMEEVLQAVTARDTDTLKTLLSVLDRNQREMNQLLTRAKSLEGQHVPRGSDIVQFFHDGHMELDNLTATLKTTADCISMTGDSAAVSRTQLTQRGREWCVLITCLVAELDFVADTLSSAGQTTLGIPAISASQGSSVKAYANLHSKVVPLLQAETARLKDILTCFSAEGEAALRKRSEELSQSLVDIMGEVVEIAQTPVDDTTLPQAQLFARLDAGLARSRWTEKALEAEQFVQRHCHKFSTLISNLAFSVNPTDVPPVHADNLPMDVSQLQAKVKTMTQRVLQAMQLSADLQQRATVRRCLDDLTNLLPVVINAATDCAAGLDREKSERELQKAGTQWGAKVHHLLSTLRSMEDIKPALINDLERQLSAQPLEMSIPGGTAPSHIRPPPSSVHSPVGSTHNPLTRQQAPLSHSRDTVPHGDTGSRRVSANEPQLKASSQRSTALSPPSQRSSALSPSSPRSSAQTPPKESHHTSGTLADSLTPGQTISEASTMSPYRRSALYTSWLASAQYLGEEVAGWEDSDNHFVQLVHTMAKHCQHMADFARGGTSLKDSEEVANTGLSLAAAGKELEKFARSLLSMNPHYRGAGDLQRAADKISTYSSQLHIVASVLQNAPGHPQGDCILARNAANLVEAVRHMFCIAEGVSVASSLEEQADSETDRQVVDLLMRWQHKLASYRTQQAHIPQLDELGLRRMEIHNPPSLTTLLDGRHCGLRELSCLDKTMSQNE